jgi:hypothetical protein
MKSTLFIISLLAFVSFASSTRTLLFTGTRGNVEVSGRITDESGNVLTQQQLTDWKVNVFFTRGSVGAWTASSSARIEGGKYVVSLEEGEWQRHVVQEGGQEKVTNHKFEQSCDDSENTNTAILPAATSIKVRGKIIDATTGKEIPDNKLGGLILKFGNYQAQILPNSVYEVTLPRGDYDRVAELGGYIRGAVRQSIVTSTNESNPTNQVILSPSFKGWRFVLNWNANVKDLDAHLVLPDKDHISFDKRKSDDGLAVVDTDVKTGFGPETISIKELRPVGNYIYKMFVHNYSGEAPIRVSGAKVVIYHDDEVKATVEVPADKLPDDVEAKNKFWSIARLEAKPDGTARLEIRNKIVEKTSQL